MPRKQSKKNLALKAFLNYVEKYREEFEQFDECRDDALVDPESSETLGSPEPIGGNNASDASGSYYSPDDFETGSVRPISQQEKNLWFLFDNLHRCAHIREPQVFSFFLQGWLESQSIPIPTGVFNVNFFSKGRGRPAKDNERLLALLAYQRHGGYGKAAKALDPEAYQRDPKAASDRLRQLIRGTSPFQPDKEPEE